MDLPGPGREALLTQLNRRLGDGFVDFGAEQADRDEALALCDERLMETMLDRGSLTDTDLIPAIARRHVFPCWFGSALKLQGVDALVPYTPGTWYADPLLYEDDNGKRWLFCEAFNMAENRGDIAVAEFDENDHLLPPRVVLKENFHLSFPTVFDWRGEVWMLPETSADHSLTLYRCTQFPDKWEKVQAFSVGRELCDSIIVDKTPEALTVLCSETRPDNQLYTRYRRYTVRENPEAEERDDVDEFILDEDEPFNLQHRNYELGSRNAGPLFTNNDQTVRPAQVSTKVDYGVYLQFWVRRGASEVPLCAAMPQNVAIAGIDPADLIGIHTYCRDADIEVIDARYLRKV